MLQPRNADAGKHQAAVAPLPPSATGRRSYARAAIALGSNLGDRLAQLRRARDLVGDLPGVVQPIAASRVYETAPVDSAPGAPPYLNAVLELGYSGEVTTLLAELQQIEQAMGRPARHPRNASRPIDLDILSFDELIFHNEQITIPHPRLAQRRFVLQPLAELCPQLCLPGQTRTVQELLDDLPADDDAAAVRPIAEAL